MAKESSKWWWLGNHNTANFSPWLNSTLSELDVKTEEMLRVIDDEDADSFAERAEMYYKKRPELLSMVEQLYRSHRSLAERYDLLRPSSSSSVHGHGSYSHEGNENCETVKERLRKEKEEIYSEMVREKDEEKREAIRQMSIAIQMLKKENSDLKKCVSSQGKQQMWKRFSFRRLFERVMGNNWLLPKTDYC